jgi:hypothetical protein
VNPPVTLLSYTLIPLPGFVPTAVGNSLPLMQLLCISILSLPVGHMNHVRNNSRFHLDCEVLIHQHPPPLVFVILSPGMSMVSAKTCLISCKTINTIIGGKLTPITLSKTKGSGNWEGF